MYINPTSGTKECWLEKNYSLKNDETGVDPDLTDLLSVVDFETLYPVCLVDNGPFTAAAVAYNHSEYSQFSEYDGRLKTWYIVPIKNLLQGDSGLNEHEKNTLQHNY